MLNNHRSSPSNCWMYRLRTQQWVDADLERVNNVNFVKLKIREMPVPRRGIVDTLNDLYRDYPGVILTPDGQEALLDMDVFEVPNIDTWMRDFSQKTRSLGRPRIRSEARERVKILGTLFTAYAEIPSVFDKVLEKAVIFDEWWRTAKP